ncbi:MAG: BMP family ABC transporter substrate-binding protein [Oscillospiraceae bacterium]|jgi:basic membrane protein A|nr:BMP family ABC transporter substrate-binding protein [Oscillospiraceae bacterium]
MSIVKRYKRYFKQAVMAALILTTLLVGCESSVNSDAKSEAPTYDTDKYKIAVLTCGAQMRSSSNQSVWAGADKFAQESGVTTKWFSAETNAEADAVIEQILAEGFTVILNANGDITKALTEKALENPDVIFAQIDGVLDPAGVANLVSSTIPSEQSGFIAGYIAAYKTETLTVGFLGGTPNTPGYQLEAGFRAGVAFAEAETGRSVQLLTDYVGNAYNRDGGYDVMDRLYAGGADIVFVATGGDTGGGAIYAAKVLGKLCVTMSDTAYMAPDSVIASVNKKIDQVTYLTARGICDGTIKGGAPVFHGLEAGLAGLVHNKNLETKLGAEFIAQVDAVIARVQAGEIAVPSL